MAMSYLCTSSSHCESSHVWYEAGLDLSLVAYYNMLWSYPKWAMVL